MDIKELQAIAQKIESGQPLTDEEQAKVQEFSNFMWTGMQHLVEAICESLAPFCEAIMEWVRLVNAAIPALTGRQLADTSWETLGLLNCPNRRVAHLAFYGKTERIRLKNFRRAIRLSEEAGA